MLARVGSRAVASPCPDPLLKKMPSHRILSVAAAALVAATSLPAQKTTQFPSNDATIQRLWRLGMDSSHTQQLSQALFDSIGPRLTGSPGLTAASNWVIKMYKSWGIDARREQYGTWRGWRRGASHIDLVAPRTRSLEGTMLAWSPGTKGVPVTAEAIVLPKFKDSTEFVKWLPQARGKIVMLSPAWPTCRPSEDWYRWATPASMAHMDSLIAEMQRDWSVMMDENGRPDSTKLYRGTGYSLALGTGTLGTRLEKAGVVGTISSRPKLSGFPNPLAEQGGGAADAGPVADVADAAAAVGTGERSRRRRLWLDDHRRQSGRHAGRRSGWPRRFRRTRRRERGAGHRRLGRDRSVRDLQHQGPGGHAHVRGLRARLSTRREQAASPCSPRPRRAAARRDAGVQHHRRH